MRLVIVRHGKAHQGSHDGTDEARELRPKGERQARHLGECLAGSLPPVARIIASRAVRAWQTAELISERVGVPVEPHDALLVDEPVSGVVERIAEWAEPLPAQGTLVVVGHNPQLSMLAGLLGGGGTGSDVGLRTGEAAAVEIDPASPIAGTLIDRIRLEED